MSDGSYVAVTGELAAGDLILVPVRTTTAEYDSGTQTTGGFGGFGGMGGREMPRQLPRRDAGRRVLPAAAALAACSRAREEAGHADAVPYQ